MLTYLRYALATVCFAISIGCAALWWRSFDKLDRLYVPIWNQPKLLLFASGHGTASVSTLTPPKRMPMSELKLRYTSADAAPLSITRPKSRYGLGHFSFSSTASEFGLDVPLWYASLIFALAGVAALRLGRRFTLRSAIIATTIVAVLLGILVAL